jgi:hypothetical protein
VEVQNGNGEFLCLDLLHCSACVMIIMAGLIMEFILKSGNVSYDK